MTKKREAPESEIDPDKRGDISDIDNSSTEEKGMSTHQTAIIISSKAKEEILNTAKKLNNEIDWGKILDGLLNRYTIFKALRTASPSTISDRALLIEIMVEHANEKITLRASEYHENGKRLFRYAIIATVGFSGYLFLNDYLPRPIPSTTTVHGVVEYLFGANKYSANANLDFILTLLRKVTASGAMLGLIYILFATANSCFREATILLHRRHATRYIRLFSYVKNGDVDSKELQKIFGVDHVTNTGFERIRTESIRDNLVGKLIEAVGSIYKSKGGDQLEMPKKEPTDGKKGGDETEDAAKKS